MLPNQPILPATAAPNLHSGMIVDREEEKKIVENILMKAQKDEQNRAVFIQFYGLAGIGKTWLLDYNRGQANKMGIISARLDGDDLGRSRDGTYVHLTDLIVHQLQGHPTDPIPESYRDAVRKVLDDNGHTDSTNDKSSLQLLAAAFCAYLEGWLEKHVILLLLDGTDCFPTTQLHWLNQEVLDKLTEQRRLIVIYAGRVQLPSKCLTPVILQALNLNSYQVRPFTLKSTRDQLDNHPAGLPYHDEASLLHDLTLGHPKSNSAAVDYLRTRSSSDLSEELSELAHYLQGEVIQNYIFHSVAESHLRSVILLLAYPRRFESSLLSDLLLSEYGANINLNLDPASPPDIIKLIYDLMQTSLVSYDTKEGGYKVEPLLAKLIQTSDLYTNSQRFAGIHHFLSTWNLELQLDPSSKNGIRTIGDGFYHFTQYLRGILKGDHRKDEGWALNQLRQRLEKELELSYGPFNPKANEQLNELRDWFNKDAELEMIFPGAQDVPKLALDAFIVRHPPAYPAKLQITMRETNIDVSLSTPDQPVVLQQSNRGVSAAGMLSLKDVLQDIESDTPKGCQRMFRLCIPPDIQSSIQLLGENAPLQIITNYADQPWELMHDGQDYFCLKLAVGRLPTMSRFPKKNYHRPGARPSFLLIGDPNDNLPSARREVDAIQDKLRDRADITVLKGKEATLINFINCLLGTPAFDVIHFAGHAAFNKFMPSESDLKLSDGVVPARDIEGTLGYRPLIFLNACEAGYQQSEELPGSYTSSNIEGLAASCLLGGARGCIGPLWPVPDGQAADFAISFYENALKGNSLGTALRLARLESYQNAPNTKVWAAYVLYGDPTVQLL
jgi:hypothetical protein